MYKLAKSFHQRLNPFPSFFQQPLHTHTHPSSFIINSNPHDLSPIPINGQHDTRTNRFTIGRVSDTNKNLHRSNQSRIFRLMSIVSIIIRSIVIPLISPRAKIDFGAGLSRNVSISYEAPKYRYVRFVVNGT